MANVARELGLKQKDNEWYFASCLISGSSGAAVRDCSWLEPSDFINRDLGDLWKAVLDGVDPLKAVNDKPNGFMTELLVWASKTPNLARPDEYARVVAESRYGINTVRNAGEIVKAVGNKDYGQLHMIVDAMQDTYPSCHTSTPTAATVGDEFDDVLSAGVPKYVKTVLPLDNDLGGLFGGELIILAARPGMGKTALALQISKNVALSGKRVFFSSLEMARKALWARMVCGAAGYSWQDVRIGNVSDVGRATISKSNKELQSRLGDRFVIDDQSRTVPAIHMSVMRSKPDLVIIDHLGEIEWHDPDASDVVWLGLAAKYLRTNISLRMNVPTLLIHQLNRDVERRTDKRPILSDLRWSGDLEQRADVVLMMYREDYYNVDLVQNAVPTEVWTRKNRQGVMNALTMMNYDLTTQNFGSMTAIP